MNKKFFKLSLLLCGITVGAHLALTVVSLLVDIFSTNATLQQAFADVAQLFGSLAEITAYSIVLYSFVHFKPSEAYKSFYIAGGVHLSSVLLSVIPMGILICLNVGGFDAIFYYILTSFKDALFAVAYTRILPTLLIALASYNITKVGTTAISSVFNFKNTIAKSMLISALIIYLTKVITAILTNDIIAVSSIIASAGLNTETPTLTAFEFFIELWNNVIYAHIQYVVVYFVVQYFAMFIIYRIYKNNEHMQQNINN